MPVFTPYNLSIKKGHIKAIIQWSFIYDMITLSKEEICFLIH